MVSPLVQAMTFQNSVNPAQSGIAPTDVVGAYKLASDAAEKNYAAKIAAQNAKFGGLAGLGGAGVLAFGPTAAKKLFGSGASTAAGVPGAAADATAAGGAAPLASGASLGDAATFPFASLGGDAAGAAFPSVASLGGAGAADAGAGTVAADLAAAAPVAAADAGGAAAAGGALASMPEWLMALLPFLA